MIVSKRYIPGCELRIAGVKIQQVQKFKYQESIVTDDE